MSIARLQQFIKDTRTAIPIFAAAAKAKVLHEANSLRGIQPGLILGTLASAVGAFTGYSVGFTVGTLVDRSWKSEITQHTPSLGAAAGAYIGGKTAQLVTMLSNHPDSELRLGRNAEKGAAASHLIIIPFTLTQYASKAATATALAVGSFGRQIVNGAVWASQKAKESYENAVGENVLRELRSRIDAGAWPSDMDRILRQYEPRYDARGL